MSGTVWWQYLFPVAALCLASTLLWLSRYWRTPLAGFLFFVGTLFPALGFLNVYPFRFSFVADHFQYLACLGIIVPCAAGLAMLAQSLIPRQPWLPSALGAGLLFILGMSSWQRSRVYESEERLWTDTLAKNPGCWMAHTNLGNLLLTKGQVDEAIAEYQTTLAINPNYADAHYNLGNVLLQKGQVDEAIVEYQKALEINPNYDEARCNLGDAFYKKGHLDEAITQYQKALEINPEFAKAHNNLGDAL